MCGIAGLISCGDRDVLSRMTSILAHRGPDDSGIEWFVDANAGLGHRRLSILDLSAAGHQPMANAQGARWIAYNGEVYNFLELRTELEARGHRFRTATDTEVILAAFDEWGSDCVSRLSGMFAFGIYDTESRELFLARDHLGIKPLYYWHSGERFAFASEAKALFELDSIERRPDFDAVLSSLMLLWVPEPKTGFAGISKLEAGHFAWLREGRFESHQYWEVPKISSFAKRKEGELVDELCEILERVVRRQMIADVPVGSLLSGGLDSSLVTALMRKVRGDSISTYTIAFTEEDLRMEAMPDDARYAREVSRLLETDHHEIVVHPDINDLLPLILWHLDEPVADGAAINTYLIARGARERGTEVLLSGMGADEVFGGYRKHLATLYIDQHRRLPWILRKLISLVVEALPVAIRGKGILPVRWAKKFLRSASLPPVEAFIRGFSYYNPEELLEVLGSGFDPARIDETWPVQRYHQLAAEVRDLPLLNQMTFLDTKLFLPGLNLAYTDKASMAASVETRPPLIDVEVVEFAARLPAEWKIRGTKQKYILKKVAERYLPSEIVHRRKAAFGTPIRAWMRQGLADQMRGRLAATGGEAARWLDGSFGTRLLDEHIAGREDNAHRLWGLLVMEEWLDGFGEMNVLEELDR